MTLLQALEADHLFSTNFPKLIFLFALFPSLLSLFSPSFHSYDTPLMDRAQPPQSSCQSCEIYIGNRRTTGKVDVSNNEKELLN